jgi:excisionase family DNA binding protein
MSKVQKNISQTNLDNNLIAISLDAFNNLLLKISEIQDELQKIKTPEKEEILRFEDLAKLLKTSKSNVYRMNSNGELNFPKYIAGKSIVFKRSEVLASLERVSQSDISKSVDNYIINGKPKKKP